MDTDGVLTSVARYASVPSGRALYSGILFLPVVCRGVAREGQSVTRSGPGGR